MIIPADTPSTSTISGVVITADVERGTVMGLGPSKSDKVEAAEDRRSKGTDCLLAASEDNSAAALVDARNYLCTSGGLQLLPTPGAGNKILALILG